MWAELLPVGRSASSGGYRRFAWNSADAECRAWFEQQARDRGLQYELDRNGNQWAWLGDPHGEGAVVTGSHLDSVPDGGAFDGPLGVVSAFAALDELRSRGAGVTKPLAIVNFGDEEGARFGVACIGSRLTAGVLSKDQAHDLRDADGVRLPDAMEKAGYDPDAIGADRERLGRIGAFVELHVEQGRYLAEGQSVGVASAIWPHGRWRFDFHGEANHAGTTRIEDRRDPMLTYANTVLAARKKAKLAGALATFGKVAVEPNGTNAIASLVRGWLDSRAADEATLDRVVEEIRQAAYERGERDGVRVELTRESYTPVVDFDGPLRDRLARVIGRADGRPVPVLPTGAGHDAGILASAIPTAMLFVRNPSGVSHSPAEHAEENDCLAGVAALADVLEDLACQG
ncbi:allantoate amidohydrolase [Kitasatospora sp. DSM 101779]|uniref:allantoate amidohydrolase n=1 Tax=Kitasatospora sp. DSM 101779 TaxID=2853165 RepID=UPI0021D7DB29|nr:allantoate amidohydrolase [Kitasatospora sp. DSM 101779]MCU7824464.1 allantoate amidohydrolase [Kitasatospora sp. DSM 101779]